ncbi:hypothetical protein C0993_001545 [Termitomyces sp. T159_Od127]|nr:hypothetical protein C0993_001545 [Termitomyces sp. T159_Od127]
MTFGRYFSLFLGLVTALHGTKASGSAMQGMDDSKAIQQEQIQRMHDFLGPVSNSKGSEPATTMTFNNPAAKQFFVDGTKIPDGESKHVSFGLRGHGANPSQRREQFEQLLSIDIDRKVIVIHGLGQTSPMSSGWNSQSGHVPPISYLYRGLLTFQPQTGFTQGTPNITNDDELAAQLTGFLGQFLEVFSELKGNNLYLTGESIDVPYIANWIYEHPGLDLNLKGIWIADPSLSYEVVQQEIPALRFAQANKNLFPLNSSFWADLQTISDECGYTDYLDKFVTYPPNGQLPLPVATNGTFTVTPACRIHNLIQRAVGLLNPVFDVYR